MIIKIITLFLIGMMVLAMFGKLRVGKFGAIRCTKCNGHIIGRKCPCGAHK